MFILWMIAYILLGVLTGTVLFWLTIKEEDQLTLKDLFLIVVSIVIWPIFLLILTKIAIEDSDNIVIWKKKK